MPRTWQTSGVIYAQDDFPQCALYTAIERVGDGGGGGGGGRFRQDAKKRGADVSGAPLFPFAFSIQLIHGADIHNTDEKPVGAGGGGNGEEEETLPLFVATWRRDREQMPAETDTGPKRHVVRRRQMMSLIPMDYGIAVSDFL